MDFKQVTSILRTPNGNFLVAYLDGANIIEVLVSKGKLGIFIEEFFKVPDWFYDGKEGDVDGKRLPRSKEE